MYGTFTGKRVKRQRYIVARDSLTCAVQKSRMYKLKISDLNLTLTPNPKLP